MNWYSVFCRVKLTASSAFVFGLLMVVLTSKLGSSATTFLLASRNVDFEQPSGVVIQAGGDPQSFIVRSEAHDMPESLIRSPLDQLAPRRFQVIAHTDDRAAIWCLDITFSSVSSPNRFRRHMS